MIGTGELAGYNYGCTGKFLGNVGNKFIKVKILANRGKVRIQVIGLF